MRRVLILTNYLGAYTGFGRNIRSLATYLYKNHSDKIELHLAAAGMHQDNPDFLRWPFKNYGVLPNNQHELNFINSDGYRQRQANYGELAIEKIVHDVKPDLIIGIEDIWGMEFLKKFQFARHIPIIYWSTVDSLPLLSEAIDTASQAKYYWTWADFATDEFHKKGFSFVKTQYPCFDDGNFHPLPPEQKIELRARHNIPQDAFIVGFVFRNQIRKLVDRLIAGFAIFQKQNPDIKNCYLYTHTSYKEGWNIPALCDTYGVDKNKVLCTYICRATKEYFISPFIGEEIDNKTHNIPKSLTTVDVSNGVTESQLNEIYNVFDLYMHPATSGACEMPIVEAAFAGNIVSTSAYSFGQDVIKYNKTSIPIDFSFYTEIGTQFLKSSQDPNSIAKIIKQTYSTPKDERVKLGLLSRKWALDNYSVSVNAEKILTEILRVPQHSWNFEKEVHKPKNPLAVIPDEPDDIKWIRSLYANILGCEGVKDDDAGLLFWKDKLSKTKNRQEIESYFRNVSHTENQKINQTKPFTLDGVLNKDDKKRVCLCLPESIGDVIMATSLFKSVRDRYPRPEWTFYFATKEENFPILFGNPYLDHVIEYRQEMDNFTLMEGQWDSKGYFDVFYPIHFGAQRLISYVHNSADKQDLKFS